MSEETTIKKLRPSSPLAQACAEMSVPGGVTLTLPGFNPLLNDQDCWLMCPGQASRKVQVRILHNELMIEGACVETIVEMGRRIAALESEVELLTKDLDVSKDELYAANERVSYLTDRLESEMGGS